jgi:hypothetical protein
MKRILIIFLFLPFLTHAQSEFSVLGKEILPFEMRSVNKGNLNFDSFPNAKGFAVVFFCNHCPMAKLYDERIQDLERKFSSRGVHVIAVNPMDSLVYEEESWKEMVKRASRMNYVVPYVQDGSQDIARQFNAQHTPEAFVVWKEGNRWFVLYEGSFDDNGEHPNSATPFLANAISDLLEGKPVTATQTESFGCRIFYRKK